MRRVHWRRSARSALWALLALVLCAGNARAQDERRVVSPNGQLEFRLFVSPSGNRELAQLAYQVIYRGEVVIKTSFLGLHIHNQEPMLGEKVGLVESNAIDGGSYRSLIAKFMQNGSRGRLIDVEVRVWDNAVAFRYVIPRSTPLDEILIEDELTEFDLSGGIMKSGTGLPVAVSLKDGGLVRLSEVPRDGFPQMSLTRVEGGVLTARLTRRTAESFVAFEGRTPLVCSWRVLTFASDREQTIDSSAVRELEKEEQLALSRAGRGEAPPAK